MYVAITRAKEKLFLTRSRSRYLYGKREPTARSQFVNEIADRLDLGEERVYPFLFDLLDEISALFPSRYFHIGGDEAPKSEWKNCRKCRALMEREGLKNCEQLQVYFTNRIIAHL